MMRRSAVSGGWGPGNSGLLLYDRAAGFAAFYAIDAAGNLNLLQQSDGSVGAAVYVVVEPGGRTVAHVTKYLESLSGVSGAPVRGSEPAPIVAFELNRVGPVNSERTTLSSSAGNIVYTASTPLTALCARTVVHRVWLHHGGDGQQHLRAVAGAA
jgi:hypothetical protein